MVALQPRKAYASELAEFLDREIKRRGLSEMQASIQAGLSKSTLNGIIASGTASYASLVKLADFFGIPRETLLEKGGFSSTVDDEGEQSALPEDAQTVLRDYLSLDDVGRHILLEVAQSLRLRRSLEG
jgi:transcriptional regulator with XRE-family HTH domain